MSSETGTVTISAEDFGLLMYCAVSYDRQLNGGHVPVRMWDQLPQEWRDKIHGLGGDSRWEEQSLGDRLLAALSRSSALARTGDWHPAASAGKDEPPQGTKDGA